MNINNRKEKKFIQKKWAGIIWGLLAACLLAGCQAGSGETPDQEVETAAFVKVWSQPLEETGDVSAMAFSGDTCYYSVSEGDDSAASRLYTIDLDTMEKKELYARGSEEGGQIIRIAVSPTGEAALLVYGTVRRDTGEKDDGYTLVIVNSEGQETAGCDISEALAKHTEEQKLSGTALAMDGEGNVYFLAEGKETGLLLEFDSEGGLKREVPVKEEVKSLFSLDSGEVYCITMREAVDGGRVSLQKFSEKAETGLEFCQELSGAMIKALASGYGENAILLSADDIIYSYDPDSNQMSAMGNWLNYGVNSDDIWQVAGLTDGRIAAAVSSYENTEGLRSCELVILSQEVQSMTVQEEADPITLTLGTVNLDVMMRSWIADYNKSHPECIIEVKEYGQGDQTAGIMQLNADIVSGHGPDLLDLSDVNVSAYIEKGILTDLDPFLENDAGLSEEDILPGVLQLYQENDGLYGMAPGVTLETLMGKEAAGFAQEEWTLEKMQEFLAEPADGTELVEYLSPTGFLRIVMQTNMDSYIDWEAGQCYFDQEGFIQVLELADSLQDMPFLEEDTGDKIANGSLLLYRAYIGGIQDYLSACSYFGGEKVVCVGYPSADGGHAKITPYMPMGISEACGHKQEAWEFVKSLLSQEFQTGYMHFQLPARADLLLEEMEKYVSGDIVYGDTEITQDSMDNLYNAVNTGIGERAFHTDIWNIIQEEAEAYFAGEKTATEAASLIQGRVEIYVSEQY